MSTPTRIVQHEEMKVSDLLVGDYVELEAGDGLVISLIVAIFEDHHAATPQTIFKVVDGNFGVWAVSLHTEGMIGRVWRAVS